MTYSVERTGKEVYDHCEKHTLALKDGDGKTVVEQRVSFSNWQLDDESYDDRVKQWADRRISEDVDRETDIKVEYSI